MNVNICPTQMFETAVYFSRGRVRIVKLICFHVRTQHVLKRMLTNTLDLMSSPLALKDVNYLILIENSSLRRSIQVFFLVGQRF